ncbi:hypothetical protein VTL71DRAFT_9207 [Oculimacula yallundae]|uniref:Uncharacterized protein n=1 Tax=Oculimacula yallundae TaxID=86028 RepID=A0ABR4BSE1_9HELO
MSGVAKNVSLLALGAAGTYLALNTIAKPKTTHSIAASITNQLDNYNDSVQPDEEDRGDHLFNTRKLLKDTKTKRPWNMTYAEKERNAHAHEDVKP